MNTNEMYQAAIDNMKQNGEYYGVSRFTLANGDVLICSIKRVAGQSVVSKHHRTTYHLKFSFGQFSKQISKAKAVELLK